MRGEMERGEMKLSKRILNKRISLILSVALILLIFSTAVKALAVSSSYIYAKRIVENLYTGGAKYPPITSMMMNYLLKAADDPFKLKARNEDEVPDAFQGKIFYKSPHYLRMDMEFLSGPFQGERLIYLLNGQNLLIFKEGYPNPIKIDADPHYPLTPYLPFYGFMKYEENIRYKPFLVAEGVYKGFDVWIISIIDSKEIVEKARLYVDKKTYVPVRMILPPKKDRPKMEYIYRGFLVLDDGRPFPSKVLIYVYGDKGRFLDKVFIFKSVIVNQEIPDSIFETPIKPFLPPSPPPVTPPIPPRMR